MQATGNNRRQRLLAVAIAAAASSLSAVASAQLTTWVGPAAGSWGVGANWNNGVPNSGTAVAFVDGGNAQNTTAVIDFSITLNSLNVSSGDQVNVGNNNTLNWSGTGTLSNAGTVNMNAGVNNTIFSIAGGTLNVVGTGVLSMNQTGAGGAALIQGGGTLVNSSTIAGMGGLGNNNLAIINTGTIIANNGTQGLGIDVYNIANALRNTGTILASGGDVFITGSGGGSADNTGGTLSAAGSSSVRLINSISITGGTFTTSGAGTVRASNSSSVFLSSYANRGNFTVDNNSIANNSGAIVNSGSININAEANAAQWTQSGVTLSGGGTVNLSEAGAGAAFFANGGGTLTNVDNTIRGRGQIGSNNGGIVNQAGGSFVADVAGQVLNLDPFNVANAFTNSGSLRATNTGILQLTGFGGGDFNNTSGVISADSGSEVRLVNSVAITGGTLQTSGTGVVRVLDGNVAFLSSVNLVGNMFVQNNSTANISGSLANFGSISLNANANSAALSFNGGSINLSGGGSIVLVQTGAGGTAVVTGSGTLVSNNNISGRGNVGNNSLAIVNNATINANNPGGGIGIDPSNAGFSFVNNGTITATANVIGLTGFGGGGFDNTNGRIIANGGDVQLQSSVTLTGGTLTSQGASTVRVIAGNIASLSNINISGNTVIENNATLNATGTFTNNGTISIEAGANAAQLVVTNLPLTGAGTVILRTTGAGVPFITGGGTFVNAGSVIRGLGSVGSNALAITNQPAGVIAADVAGAALTIDPSNAGTQAFRNQGTLRATAGATLVLTGFGGGGFDNGGGSITAQTGSTLSLQNSVSIVGGTLTANAGAAIDIPGGNLAFFTDLTTAGSVAVQNNSTLNIIGTVNNTGSININPTANGTQLQINSSMLLGGGTINMNRTAAGSPIITGGGTFVTNNVIRGAGELGSNALAIVSSAAITADIPSFPLNVDPSSAGATAYTNNGTLQAQGGVLVLTGFGGGGFANNGRIIAGSTDVQLTSSVAIAGGTLSSSGAGVFQLLGGQTATLTNLTLEGNLQTRNNTTLNVGGTVTNLGSITLNASANPATLQPSNATINGGGVITMASIGVAEPAITGGGTFTTNNLIQGRGLLGSNAIALVSTGMIHANVSGATLLIDPPSAGPTAFDNSGTLQASGGGILTLTGFGGGGHLQTGPTRILAGSTLNAISSAGVAMSTVELQGTFNSTTSSSTTLTHFRGAGTVNINSSSFVRVNAGGGTLGTSSTTSLNIATSGRLDLTNHDLLLDYTGASPLAAVRGLLQSGFGGGTWNGATGIISTSAAASTSPKTAIGYAEASEILGPTGGPFSGLVADGTSLLLQYTVAGDADLNKAVNLDDFTRLAAAFGTAGNFWSTGDFNYDGTVNLDDFTILAANFGLTIPTDLPRGESVPEPMLGGAAMAMLLAGSMRRRHRRG